MQGLRDVVELDLMASLKNESISCIWCTEIDVFRNVYILCGMLTLVAYVKKAGWG